MKTKRSLAKWREAEAIRLRLEGFDYQDIARALGYRSRSGAWKAVNRSLSRQVAAGAEEYRAQMLMDIEIAYEHSWPKAMAGNNKAMDHVLRLSDQRIRLLGLAQPSRNRSANVHERPARASSTWTEPTDQLHPFGSENDSPHQGVHNPQPISFGYTTPNPTWNA